MFNLEQSLAQWRRQMRDAGLTNPATLDELESHLREDFRRLLSRGEAETRAFALAAAQLGPPRPLQNEFQKLRLARHRPLAIGSALWLAAALPLAISLGSKLRFGLIVPLLAAHIFTLVTGYIAAFIAGALAFWHAGQHWPSARPSPALSASRFFNLMAALLVLVASCAGLVWVKSHLGSYFPSAVEQAKTFLAELALIACVILQSSRRFSLTTQALASVAASLLVSLAWFLPYAFDSSFAFWASALFLAANIACYSLARLSPPKLAAP